MDSQSDLDFTQLQAKALGRTPTLSRPQAGASEKKREHERKRNLLDTHKGTRQANDGLIPTLSAATTVSGNFQQPASSGNDGHGRVNTLSESPSQPYLPHSIPDSQPPSKRQKMSYPGSLPRGDTQPVSPSVHESIIGKSRTEQDGQDGQQVPRLAMEDSQLETQRTLLEGDPGHVDLISILEEPEDEREENGTQYSDPGEQWDPANISPTQLPVGESPEDLRFRRPKTPATVNGRKRDSRGDFVDTSSTPINPLAGNGTPAAGVMGLSQMFNATQAPSSPPLARIPTSDPLSNPPSPTFEVHRKTPTVASFSSPSKLPSSTVTRKPFREPQTRYRSMKESQEERQKRFALQKSSEANQDSESSDSNFDEESSQVIDYKRRRKIAHLTEVNTSPVRPRSRGTTQGLGIRSSPPKSVVKPDQGTSMNAIVIADNPPGTYTSEKENASEEETDVDDDLDAFTVQRPKFVSTEEEDKENVDTSKIQVPMSTTRLQAALTSTHVMDSTPSRPRNQSRSRGQRITDEDPGEHLLISTPGMTSSPNVMVPNSQPSQPFRSSLEKSINATLHLDSTSNLVPSPTRNIRQEPLSSSKSFIPASSPSQIPFLEMSKLADSSPGVENLGSHANEDGVQDPIQASSPDNQTSHVNGDADDGPQASSERLGAEVVSVNQISTESTENARFERQPGFGSSRMLPGLYSISPNEPSLNIRDSTSGGESKEEHLANRESHPGPTTGSLHKSMSRLIAPSKQQEEGDTSSPSSHYDTARSHAAGGLAPQSPANSESLSQRNSLLISPSGKKRAGLMEIAAEILKENSFDDVDLDIDVFTNDDQDYQDIVGDPTSPVRPRRRVSADVQTGITMVVTTEQVEFQDPALSPARATHAHEEETNQTTSNNDQATEDTNLENSPVTEIRQTSQEVETVWDVSSHSPQKKTVVRKPRSLMSSKEIAVPESINQQARTIHPKRSIITKPKAKATTAANTESADLIHEKTAKAPAMPDSLQYAVTKPATVIDPARGVGTKPPPATDPIQEGITAQPADDPVEDVTELSDNNVLDPNMVFALATFSGLARAYYPAACLGPVGTVGSDSPRLRVKFQDTNIVELSSTKVRKLQLRVGDYIKVNMKGTPKIPHVVRGFKNKLGIIPPVDFQARDPILADIFGHTTVIVTPKKRTSISGQPGTEAEETKEVPIASVYLDGSLWPQLLDRKYHFIPPPDAAGVRVGTPSVLSSTPSTPSRRARTAAVSGIEHRPTTGLFANMVFGVSYGDQEERKSTITKLILSNGGTIATEGFSELFNTLNAGPTTPTKRSALAVENDLYPDGPLTLSTSAETVSFVALLADKHSRREKYLQALALNLPCLSGRWIDDCVSANQVLPWETYLFPAGESAYLEGAVRNRVLAPYEPLTSNFSEIVANRPKLLEDRSVVITTGKGRGEEKRKPFVFLTYALGASKVCRVPDLKAAQAIIDKERNEWDMVYVDDHEEAAARDLFETPADSRVSRKRKNREEAVTAAEEKASKKPRVMVNEAIVQSMILGRLYEDN